MNLILFSSAAEAACIPMDSPQGAHIQEVLRMDTGDALYVGVANGPRGKARIEKIDTEGYTLAIAWETFVPPSHPVTLVVGMPRPQTARRILSEAASLGVTRLWFFGAEKGEPSYAESSLWVTDEWQRYLRRGAEQAFTTRIPDVQHFSKLQLCIDEMDTNEVRLALDIYEATQTLYRAAQGVASLTLALGAERGWSAGERNRLREAGFGLVHLGERVLRTETACIAGLSVALSAMGQLEKPYKA